MSGLEFAALTLELETTLAAALRLTAGEPFHLEGELRGGRACLETRRYTGRSIRYARVALFQAPGIEIGNLLFFPSLDRAAPILGADLVGLSASSGLVAADLSPAGSPPVASAALEQAAEGLPSAGPLPAWASAIFSPRPLFARVDGSNRGAAATALRAMAGAFVEALRSSPADQAREPSIRASHSNYCRLHRQDDRTLGVLTKAFGERRARRYLSEVLFPEPVEDQARLQ